MKLIKFFAQIITLFVLLTSNVVAGDKWASKTKALTKKSGLFTLYGSAHKSSVLFQVDKLEQPFIYVTSLMQGVGSNNIGLDRGQIGESRLVQFERLGDKVVLRQLNPYYRAQSDNVSERSALTQAFAQSILYSFDIIVEEKQKLLIDVSNFSKTDFHDVTATLKNTQQGSFSVDQSRSIVDWENSKSFPNNTELSSVVTFKGAPKGRYLSAVTPDARFVSIKFRHSFVALPDDDYQPRAFHPYSGYFPFEYQDYSQPIDKPLTQRFITRHRLALNQQGKILKPITYYLDPGVPEPIKSALLDGARWWSTAFDDAGLKGGFKVKLLPVNADPLDVRYNVIQWVHRATRGWSYGSSVIDPRTGEILKGHVTLGSLRVRQDYLIASGLLSGQPKKVATIKAQSMALSRIRQLSAHEIGHTLGIAHNFAASHNDRASVMDYPHPLVSLKNNEVSVSNAYAVGMGAWDNYVIKYGYGEFSKTQLGALITQTKNNGLKFTSDSEARNAGGSNPWAHLWDNGERADIELTRLMTVRNKALRDLNVAMLDPSQPHSDLREAIVPIYLLHRFQVTAAAKIVAGVDFNYALRDELLIHKVVDKQWQLNALTSILNTLNADYLTFSTALLSKLPAKSYGTYDSRESVSSQLGRQFDPLALAEASARHSLITLLHSSRINRLVVQHAIDNKQLALEDMIKLLLDKTVKLSAEVQYSGLNGLTSKRINAVVLEQLLKAFHDHNLSLESQQVLTDKLQELARWLMKKSKRHNSKNKSYIAWLSQQLEQGLKDHQYMIIKNPIKLPPGSPI